MHSFAHFSVNTFYDPAYFWRFPHSLSGFLKSLYTFTFFCILLHYVTCNFHCLGQTEEKTGAGTVAGNAAEAAAAAAEAAGSKHFSSI